MTTKAHMTQHELAELAEELASRSTDLLRSKGLEYADIKGDRLNNFNKTAEFLGTEPEQVALCYLMKHVQAIQTMLAKGEVDWRWTKEDGTEASKSRFADAINYIVLIAAIVDAKQRAVAKEATP